MDHKELDELRSVEELASYEKELGSEIKEFETEFKGLPYPPEVRDKYAAAKDERKAAQDRIAELTAREAYLKTLDDDRHVETAPEDSFFRTRTSVKEQDIYDLSTVDWGHRERASGQLRDRAMRAIELTKFPHPTADQDEVRGHIEGLLQTIDRPAALAQHIMVTGRPAYRRAFGKKLAGRQLTAEEQRAVEEVEERGLSETGASGGFAVTFDLDPTIVPTSNGAVNPFRRACRNVTITTNEWRGVSSGGVVAQYRAEEAAVTDNAPTLAQPAFIPQRADAFIPFSIEIGQDWQGLQTEMAREIQDGKDVLEAAQFATGVGTTVFPQGVTVGFTNTATTGTTTVLAVNDLYKTEEALPPRFRPRAQWFANRFIYNKVRQLDTAGGANLWVPDLRTGLPANETGNTGFTLLGYPANEASGMAASLATTTKLAVLADPNYYVVVDRIGMNIELIPHLFGAAQGNLPTGRRGVFAMWRNTARVFAAAGGVTLVGL